MAGATAGAMAGASGGLPGEGARVWARQRPRVERRAPSTLGIRTFPSGVWPGGPMLLHGEGIPSPIPAKGWQSLVRLMVGPQARALCQHSLARAPGSFLARAEHFRACASLRRKSRT